jgi:hypothetical protein
MSFRRIELDIGGQYDLMELGVAGENMATRLIIDCRSVIGLYPDALITVLIRHDRCIAYPAAIGLVPDDKCMVYYDVTSADTSVAGKLTMEIQAHEDEVLVKSVLLRFNVLPSIGKVMDTPFNPGQAWEDRLIQLATDVSRGTLKLDKFIDLVSGLKIEIEHLDDGEDIILSWEIIEGEDEDPDQLNVLVGLPPGFGTGEIPPELIQAGTIEIVDTILVSGENASFEETSESTEQHRKYVAKIPAAEYMTEMLMDQKIDNHNMDYDAHPNMDISGGEW